MDIFNDKYIWKLYNQMMSTGSGTIEIPNTNYRLKEVAPYEVAIQVETLYKTKNGNVRAVWKDTDEIHKVNVLNSSEWDAMFS